jgi:hypothetical protein
MRIYSGCLRFAQSYLIPAETTCEGAKSRQTPKISIEKIQRSSAPLLMHAADPT